MPEGASVLVFLVHAHRDVSQLNRLIGLLAGQDSAVFVNLDRKSPIDAAEVDPRARLVRKRIDIWWGDWSQVEATLNSLREIEASGLAYGHVVFISGEDYPVLDLPGIRDALMENTDYIGCTEVSDRGWACQIRYTKFYGGSRTARVLFRVVNAVLARIGYERSVPGGLVAYAGGSWWNLTQPTVRAVLEYVRRNPGIVRFFEHTLCPDEMFFQTIIKHQTPAPMLVDDNLRYVHFVEGDSRPEILDLSHAARILESNALFIRKVRDPISLPLLRYLASERNLPPIEV